MKRKKIILTNDFHNTEIVAYPKLWGNGDLEFSTRQAKSCRNKLCGVIDCVCGDSLGCRPGQLELISIYSDCLIFAEYDNRR